VGLEPTATGL